MAAARFPVLPLGAGLLLGGLLTALALELVRDEQPTTAARDAQTAAALEQFAQRLDLLARQDSDTLQRLRAIELALIAATAGDAAASAQPLAEASTPELLAGLRQEVAELADAVSTAPSAPQGPIVNQVVEALGVIEEQQRAEREAERAEWLADRQQRALERLTADLALDAYQQEKMKALLADASEKRRALDDQDLGRDERRTARDALRADIDRQLAGFLSASQLQTLTEQGGLDDGGGPERRRWR